MAKDKSWIKKEFEEARRQNESVPPWLRSPSSKEARKDSGPSVKK